MRTGIESFESAPAGGRPRRARPRRLSHLFAAIAANAQERVSVGAIRDELGQRSFAALLVLFGALNLLPLPPGASAILGLPLLIVSAQLMLGARRAWLPDFVARKSLSAEQFRALVDRIVPRLVRVEQLIRPRYWPFWRRHGDRFTGTIAFLLAIIVTLPIPLGNWLPALSITLFGLALTERDGLLFGLAGLVGIASIVVVASVGAAAGFAAHAALGWMF